MLPWPRHVETRPGTFRLDASTTLTSDAETAAGALRRGSGLPLAPAAGGDVRLILRPGEPEAYELDITPEGVVIAGDEPGVFYGVQTLLQLLPEAPCLRIVDAPRFRWRGALLDVGRHFMPKAFVLRFIDLLALHKLNTLHLHLTEDQGWRIEIQRYPRLTEVGAWRAGTMVGHKDAAAPGSHDGVPHGGFYTQADIREIVAYAAARHVTVMPEIEMPGHAQAAIAAYPELGNLATPLQVRTGWGISPHVFNVEPATLRFCQEVLEEVLDLFPSEFIHVGGDECPKDEWRASPAAQARMRDLGLRDEDELQSWFLQQAGGFLAARGRRMVGWDEILEGGLPPGATVMSWHGEQGGIEAARLGHDVVMTPDTHTYFDYYQAPPEGEPLAIGGLIDLETVYAYDPPVLGGRVLGSQFQLWTEYMPTPAHVEYMAFPRACAFAEVVWSGRNPAFADRLADHLTRLEGVNFRGAVRPSPA